jgi:hypothetical protein
MKNDISSTGAAQRVGEIAEHLDQLHEIIWSKMYGKMLQVALEVNLFQRINGLEPASLEQISRLCGLPVQSTQVLLQYLCSMKLLAFEEGAFSNTPLSSTLVNNEEVFKEIEGWGSFLDKLDALEFLKLPPAQPWYQLRNTPRGIVNVEGISEAFFTSDMRHTWRVQKGMKLASAYDFSRHQELLDIGGASGGWSVGIKNKFPHLSCGVFDLPEVCRLGRQMMAQSGAAALTFYEGNFFADELPGDADVVLLANVLHDWNPADGRHLLKKVHNYLPTGGVVLVYEFFLNDNWQSPPGKLFNGITVLGRGNETGWQPSYAEMETLLAAAGFEPAGRRNDLVIGRKSA